MSHFNTRLTHRLCSLWGVEAVRQPSTEPRTDHGPNDHRITPNHDRNGTGETSVHAQRRTGKNRRPPADPALTQPRVKAVTWHPIDNINKHNAN